MHISRLTAALLERLAAEPHTRLRYFCSPQHTDSAFYPIISQMERAARLARGDTTQTKLDKLDAMLAQTSTAKQDVAFLAEMLSLLNDGRYPAVDLEPQQRRQKTLEALTARVEALSRQNPVLMIFEDAHWTDPTSLEAFGRVVDRVRSLPVLLIVTFRSLCLTSQFLLTVLAFASCCVGAVRSSEPSQDPPSHALPQQRARSVAKSGSWLVVFIAAAEMDTYSTGKVCSDSTL